MKSPLSYYKEVAEEFGIIDDYNVSPVGKLSWVQEQVVQQRQIIHRLLTDISTAASQKDKAKDPDTITAYRKKIDGYKDDLRQLVAGVRVNLELIEELREEYPELKVEE